MDFSSTSGSSGSGKPTTDPGLGPRPASDPPPPLTGGRAHGVIVPAPTDRTPPYNPSAITPPEFRPLARSLRSSPNLAKDSVELLLEGMTGPRPERRKTTPQSDGEASAAYHAEHGLRAARSSSEPGPKVVVEKTPPPSRPRLTATTVPGGGRARPAGSLEALSTFVPARVLRRRIAMAVVAAVLMVFVLFIALRFTQEQRVATPSPPSPPPAHGAQAPTSPATAAPVGPAASVASQPATTAVAPPAPPAETPSPSPEPSGAHASSGRHHHGDRGPTDNGTGDLGEFKSKF